MTALVKNLDRLQFMRCEALRVGGMSPEFLQYLRQHKLSLGTIIAHAGFLNVGLVRFWAGDDGDRSFSFDREGQPAAVIEALLFDRCREQVVADIVAWPVDDPKAFATAMGANDGADVLGSEWMIRRGGRPLRVYRTPLTWLQANCEGCVPLKGGARHWLARAGGPFICDDLEHGRELRDMLGPAAAFNRILVPQNQAGAA